MSKTTEIAKNILIGDDDRGCRGALGRLFKDSGFDVVTAATLSRTLKHIIEYKPVALVIEYAFPDGRTVSILEKIRRERPFMAIIMLTGAADIEAAADVLGKGLADRFLTKPWDDNWLLDVVDGVLREKALLMQNAELVEKLREANAGLEEKIRERTLQLERAKREWEMTFDVIDEPIFILNTLNMTIQRANIATSVLIGLDIQALAGQVCYQALLGSDRVCANCPARTGKNGRNRLIIEDSVYDAIFFKAGDGSSYVVHLRKNYA